jgi:hypothetical protein
MDRFEKIPHGMLMMIGNAIPKDQQFLTGTTLL